MKYIKFFENFQLFENKLMDPKFLNKKNDLLDYLYEIGLEKNPDSGFSDIDKNGENDMEMFSFEKGNVEINAGVAFFSNGEIKYVFYVKNKNGDIVLEPTIIKNIEDLKKQVEPHINKSYDDTKLKYLGIENENEYKPSKSEYNELLNKAIDSDNWVEVKRLQDKYGSIYK